MAPNPETASVNVLTERRRSCAEKASCFRRHLNFCRRLATDAIQSVM